MFILCGCFLCVFVRGLLLYFYGGFDFVFMVFWYFEFGVVL